MDLTSPQHHVEKASKPSRHVVIVFVGYYDVVVGLLLTLGTMVQVGACTNHVEHLKVSRISSSLATTLGGQHEHPSQVGGPIHIKFESISTQEQPSLKLMSRSHTNSIFDVLHKHGNLRR